MIIRTGGTHATLPRTRKVAFRCVHWWHPRHPSQKALFFGQVLSEGTHALGRLDGGACVHRGRSVLTSGSDCVTIDTP